MGSDSNYSYSGSFAHVMLNYRNWSVTPFIAAALLVAVSFGSAAGSLEPRFDKLEASLKLRADQKVQFDIAVASTQRALLSVALTAMEVKDKFEAELAKPRPDFWVFAGTYEASIERNRPLFKKASEDWKKLFALLDDDQAEVAKRFLRENLNRLLQ